MRKKNDVQLFTSVIFRVLIMSFYRMTLHDFLTQPFIFCIKIIFINALKNMSFRYLYLLFSMYSIYSFLKNDAS